MWKTTAKIGIAAAALVSGIGAAQLASGSPRQVCVTDGCEEVAQIRVCNRRSCRTVRPRTTSLSSTTSAPTTVAETGTTGTTGTTTTATTSATTTTSVTTQASATITSSLRGAQSKGVFVWEAFPSGATIAQVDFFVDGSLVHTERYAPYRFAGDDGTWDTRQVANGGHALAVKATFADGQTVQEQLSVHVDNPPPTTTTTTASATTSMSVPAPDNAYFGTMPPGTSLPSGQECASRVRRTGWEPRPQNATANRTTPPDGFRLDYISGVNYWGDRSNISPAARAVIGRVDGDFTGTTDEIIRWAACKWGFDEDLLRAVAVAESTWYQSNNGDNGQSFGLVQIKVPVHPGTWPWARDSTAFNLDYALAWRRLMFEGHMNHWVPAEAVGDELACISMWFAGDWNWTDGRNGYLSAVQRHLREKPWLSWK